MLTEVRAGFVPAKWPNRVASAFLAAGLVSSAIGLLQYFGLSQALGPWVNVTAPGEAFGNLRQRNQFASLLNMALVALIWRVSTDAQWVQGGTAKAMKPVHETSIFGAQSSKKSNSNARVAIFYAAFLGIGVAAAGSRTGLLQLVMLLGFSVCWSAYRQPRVAKVLVSAVLAFALASLLLPILAGLSLGESSLWARLRPAGLTCSSRLIMWQNVLHLIAQKPWLGWGWGELDYAHFITLYPGGTNDRFCEILDNAHNLPLHLAVELGVPFALLVCGVGFWLVWSGQFWRERDAARQMAWGVLAVIFLHSLLEYPLWYGPFQIAGWLCVALLVSVQCDLNPSGGLKLPRPSSKSEIRPSKQEISQYVPVYVAYTAMFIIAIVVWVSWDYYRVSQIYLAPGSRASFLRDNTLEKVKTVVWFENQVKFAELTITPVTVDNAAQMNALALSLLHFSPEAKVAIKLIESAIVLKNDEQARFFALRLKAAFPADYAVWAKGRPWSSGPDSPQLPVLP